MTWIPGSKKIRVARLELNSLNAADTKSVPLSALESALTKKWGRGQAT